MARLQNRGEASVSFLRASFSPKSYFPPVWFAEADDSHLTDEERAGTGADGGAPGKSSIRYTEQDDEQHFDKHLEYSKRVYRQDESSKAEPLPPRPEPLPPTVQAVATSQDLIAADEIAQAKAAADAAIARVMRQQRDDEEALILILSQIL